jgi:hypothetical protein
LLITYVLEGAFLSFIKIKIQIEVTRQQESRFFLLFLLGDRRIQIRSRAQIRIHRIRIRIQEAQKHVDPVDSIPNPSAEE